MHQTNAELFNDEFKRRKAWSHAGAKRWYQRNCMKLSFKDIELNTIECSYAMMLLTRFGSVAGRYPLGKQGRHVKIWVHNSVGMMGIVGYAGDE
jgi:hypothetical protein